jgi:hypothetical protein
MKYRKAKDNTEMNIRINKIGKVFKIGRTTIRRG